VVVRVLLNNAITPVSEVERTVQYVQKYAADNGLTEAVPKAAPKWRPPQGEARDGGCVRTPPSSMVVVASPLLAGLAQAGDLAWLAAECEPSQLRNLTGAVEDEDLLARLRL
jgi:hypothetical protein